MSRISQLSNTLKELIKTKGQYLLFTGIKYIEYGITALIFFSFANLVSVDEYGLATPGFITISYSSLIILGVNQVLIKWYALSDNRQEKQYLIRYNVIYNLTFSIIIASIISFLVPLSFSLTIGGIAGLKLLQESLVNICRARQDLNKINIIYISFALTFLITYSLFVNSVGDFFHYWLFSMVTSCLLAIILNYKNIFFRIPLSEFSVWLKSNFTGLFKDGVKLAAIGAVLPLYLSIDRLILINFEVVSDDMIGNMQLADNIATVISFGISSVLFITNPVFIEKLKKKEIDIAKFIQIGYKILFGLTVFLTILIYPINLFVTFWFEKYEFITFPLVFYLFSRLFFLGLFIPNILMITYSYEVQYLKIIYIGFALLVALYSIAIYLISVESLIISILPALLCIVIIFVHLLMRLSLQKLPLISKKA